MCAVCWSIVFFLPIVMKLMGSSTFVSRVFWLKVIVTLVFLKGLLTFLSFATPVLLKVINKLVEFLHLR